MAWLRRLRKPLLTNSWPAGYDRQVLSSIDSTNDEARRQYQTLQGPKWILALQQTAGRGRRGRPWADPTGNFAATLVLPDAGDPATAALRSFVASLALYEAFVAATGREDLFTLKWPNDVLLNNGKVAGILLESIGATPGGGMGMCIGIGVNLAAAPSTDQVEAGAVAPKALFRETGCRISPEDFLNLLAPAFARYDTQMVQYGFDAIRQPWLSRAARIGEVITACMGTETVTGVFETVDQQGQLVLSTPSGQRAIAAADVFF